MISHHAVLREQLKRIGNSINKKYTVLRKQILKTSQVFDNEQIPVFPYEVCFGLFRQIIETGSLSSSMAFLPFLQNIINLGFSNAQMSREILTLLTHTRSIPKFPCWENESKLQQILAILVSKNCISLSNLSFTHSLFNVVLSLQNPKYRSLWLKSSTILYQTLQLLINDLRDNPTSEAKVLALHKFIGDLIRIVKGEQPAWLIEYGDTFLILYILAEVLDDKYFGENLDMYKGIFVQLLTSVRKDIKKCIQNGVSNNSAHKNQTGSTNSINHAKWQLTIENRLIILMRVGCKISIIMKAGFQILQQIIKIISEKRPTIFKVIAYQATNYLFRSSGWMFNLFQSQFADLFNFLLTTEFNTIKYVLSEQKNLIDLVAYGIGQQTNFCKIMGSTAIDINVLDFTPSHQVKMIVKNLEEVAYALYAIYSQKFKIDMNYKMEGKPPLEKTYKFCQKTVFETIKTILSRQMSQDTLQSLLKISQKFINLSGCFCDSSVCAIYIKLMCKYCLPSQFKLIDHRHIQINKMILNTANCLGHLFTSSCWVIVWKTLQNYSMYYNRYLLGKQELQSARESDVQILYKSMDSIFTQTPKYDDKYLLEVIRSLVQVAYQCLENNYNDETRKIFAFERIQQIYKLNLFRVCIIWPELSSSLLCITTSKVLYFRLSALTLLNTLIPLSLSYLHSHQQHLMAPFTPNNYQQLLLEPWLNLVNCQFQQIKDQLIIAVNKLIIDYGHIMTNGWKHIMDIVKKIMDIKALQAIVQTFLEKVHDHIMDVIVCVDNIERRLHDTNQKYLCLTMIWAIADYASKNQQLDVLKKIYHIFLVPEEMFNLGTEARHSSFYIFAEIIVHNCSEKSPQFWEWIFGEIKKFYQYGVNQCLQAKNKNFGEEAIKNLLTNLIKIYKKFFLVSKQWSQNTPQYKLSLTLLSNFYEFCSLVLQFRCAQIYQNVLKQCKQILFPKIKQSILLKQYYLFLQSLTQIYFVQNDSKILKCLITYLPPDVYDILGVSVEGLRVSSNFGVMYRLIDKMFLLRLEAQQKQIKLHQMRIFFEEKYHYECLKKFIAFISEQSPNLAQLFIQNFTKTLHKLKLYQDYPSLTKSLPFLTQIHLKFPNICPQLVLETVKQIVRIRKDEGWLKNNHTFKDVPIWYICIQDLIKITYEYLHKNNTELSKTSYKIILELLSQDMKVKLPQFGKDALSYYYQSQIELCYFLMQNYYLGGKDGGLSEKEEEEDVRKIGQIVSKRSSEIESDDHTRRGYNAYQVMFKIANFRGEDGYSNPKVEKNQSIFIGYLFLRIVESFDKVKLTNLSSSSQSQMQPTSSNNNSISMTQSTIQYVPLTSTSTSTSTPLISPPISLQQLKFVLKQLMCLQLKQKILLNIKDILIRVYVNQVNLNSIVLGLKQAHLFFFQVLAAKTMRCEDRDVIELLQHYFEKTSQILLNLEVNSNK